MRVFYIPTLLLLGILLSGCKANYKNVSDDEDLFHLIGQTYLLEADMSIRGINLPPGYGENIDIYTIGKLYEVRHKAPEEITFSILPKGATFIVTGVYECTNCLPFFTRRYVTVDTNNFTKAVNVPITVPMHEITSEESVSAQ